MSNEYGIDILKLYTFGSHRGWNEILKECLTNLDANRCARINRELQIGMKNLAKQKLNTPEIDVQFARWTKSLENTAKKIIKIRNPLPADDPLKAKGDYGLLSLEVKRKRDREFKELWTRYSY